MMTASDIRELTSLSSESRQTVTGAFEALEQWRDDIFSANERHLTKVLDRLAATQRATGWPDQFATAAREHLLKASKMQTHMIDQVMDAWEHQLKTPNVPLALPEGFKSRNVALFRSSIHRPHVRNDAAPRNDVGSFQALDSGRGDVAAQLGGPHVGLG